MTKQVSVEHMDTGSIAILNEAAAIETAKTSEDALSSGEVRSE